MDPGARGQLSREFEGWTALEASQKKKKEKGKKKEEGMRVGSS